jgi:hypothetical protein
MPARYKRFTLLAAMLLAPLLAAAPGRTALAAPLNYAFTVTVTSGPNNGDILPGTFSFDSASVTPGADNTQVGLLTALAFSFNGTAYTAATVNTGFLRFDAAGNLTRFSIGTNCGAGGCTVTGNVANFFIDNAGGFAYSLGAGLFVRSPVTFQQVVAEVPAPVPAALALFAVGLAGLALTRTLRTPAPA